MLRHELNALLMTIRRSAAKYSHSTVAARAIPKSGHDGKAGQPRKRFDVVGSLYCVVEVLAQERQADASNQPEDRKSTRLNSSHANISYAVFCLKKKKNKLRRLRQCRILDAIIHEQ